MRVFVTGLGMVSPLGVGVENNWAKLRNGESNIQAIPKAWLEFGSFTSQVYAPLIDLDYKTLGFTRSEIIQRDPVSLLANIATDEALNAAGIEIELLNKKTQQFRLQGVQADRVGAYFGTAGGGLDSYLSNINHHVLKRTVDELRTIHKDSNDTQRLLDRFNIPKQLSPFTVSRVISNSIASSTATKYAINGPVRTTAHACAAGTTAIIQGAELIRSGQADIVLSGGAESYQDPFGAVFKSFDIAGSLLKPAENFALHESNRPFDEDRSGFLFSQGGSASLILESEQHMEKRGAEPIGEVLAFAETFDAFSPMAPEPSGKFIRTMIENMLADAKLNPSDIDYVNAHGTGTNANDEVEAKVIEQIFKKNVAVNSTKSMLGHTFGASGAIEAIVALLSIRDQELHPSLNIENPIAELDFVTKRRQQKVEFALSQSFAFGGHNSGIIFAKP